MKGAIRCLPQRRVMMNLDLFERCAEHVAMIGIGMVYGLCLFSFAF